MVVLMALAILAASGCSSGIAIDTSKLTGCMVDCLQQPVTVTNADGDSITVVPADYQELILKKPK